MKTVQLTTENNLCISCGICKAVCPKQCISMSERNGMYIPVIGSTCINCGMCYSVCPGKGKEKGTDKTAFGILSYEDLMGSYSYLYNAWSKDEDVRHYSASGGVVTTMIYELLKNGLYNAAFVVKDLSFDHYVETELVRTCEAESLLDFSDDGHMTTKSRYIPIGHATAVEYMLSHPNERLVLVGVPCAISGLLSVIRQKKLYRENYLLIGLFCESVMNYHVWDYFKQKKFTKDKELAALHFKNKESGGWPGNIKMIFSDGSYRYYDKTYRMEVKQFFKPERCLYCVDKLNIGADISLGDNYTGIDDSSLGSNSVIVRTQRGVEAWKECSASLVYKEVDRDSIIKAQLLKDRVKNIGYAGVKEMKIESQTGIALDINALDKKGKGVINMKEYTANLHKISEGGVLSLIAS